MSRNSTATTHYFHNVHSIHAEMRENEGLTWLHIRLNEDVELEIFLQPHDRRWRSSRLAQAINEAMAESSLPSVPLSEIEEPSSESSEGGA